MPRFSLVVCTIGRRDDLRNLFQSLRMQTLADFEVVLVDQGSDDAIRAMIAETPVPFPLKYLQSERGLSLGRNLGLQYACGEVFAFPDDDCTYQPDTLADVDSRLRSQPASSGLTGRSVDAHGRVSGPRFADRSCIINETNIWRCGISYTTFISRSVIDTIGKFDERIGLGAGTPFGSGEETDYLLRAIRAGFELEYVPEITIIHPSSDALDPETRIKKDYNYAVGFGFVVQKHQLGFRYLLPHLVKPLLGAIYFVLRLDLDNARARLYRLIGRWKGYFHGSGRSPVT